MEIVRTRDYTKALKRLAKLGATEADILAMEDGIAADPTAGDMIKDSGGLRKIRFAFGNVGKRGGGRTIYYAFGSKALYLLTAFAKVDQSDLSAADRKAFRDLIKEMTTDGGEAD